MTDQFTVSFDSGAEPSTARVGGKCVGLLTMTGHGIRVPPGFAVTTDAFAAALDGGGLRAEIRSVLAGLDLSDTADTERRAAEVRGLVTDRPVPPPVAGAVAAAYRVLGAAGDVQVAVRSSAETEDLPTISFAGQYDTYLGVLGADAVVDAVRRCWASLWTARAITYRAAGGVPERGLRMAVGVQRMVDARTAGVALTVNPADGDPSKIVIDAAWGLGEPLVSGEMTPDNYVVDKVLLLPVKTTLSPQHHELVVAPNGHGLLRRAVEEAAAGGHAWGPPRSPPSPSWPRESSGTTAVRRTSSGSSPVTRPSSRTAAPAYCCSRHGPRRSGVADHGRKPRWCPGRASPASPTPCSDSGPSRAERSEPQPRHRTGHRSPRTRRRDLAWRPRSAPRPDSARASPAPTSSPRPKEPRTGGACTRTTCSSSPSGGPSRRRSSGSATASTGPRCSNRSRRRPRTGDEVPGSVQHPVLPRAARQRRGMPHPPGLRLPEPGHGGAGRGGGEGAGVPPARRVLLRALGRAAGQLETQGPRHDRGTGGAPVHRTARRPAVRGGRARRRAGRGRRPARRIRQAPGAVPPGLAVPLRVPQHRLRGLPGPLPGACRTVVPRYPRPGRRDAWSRAWTWNCSVRTTS